MRRALVTLALLAAISPATLRGQTSSPYNYGRLLSTLNPAALGQPADVSLGISSALYPASQGDLVVGDVALGRGALRLIAAHPLRFEAYGLGYGAPVLTHSLSPLTSLSLGADLTIGYLGERHAKYSGYVGNGTSLNAHLAVPLALQLGSIRWLSLTPYVAPYAEIGQAPAGYYGPSGCDPYTISMTGAPPCSFLFSGHYRTRSVGTALGVRLTAWRVGVDLGYGDIPGAYYGHTDPFSAAVSVRF